MVEAGDTVSATLKKEFGEEAMNSIEASEEEKKHTEELIAELFHSGTQVRHHDSQHHFQHKFLLRCMQGTLMTLEILTMHGWRRWPLTSTMKQVPSLP